MLSTFGQVEDVELSDSSTSIQEWKDVLTKVIKQQCSEKTVIVETIADAIQCMEVGYVPDPQSIISLIGSLLDLPPTINHPSLYTLIKKMAYHADEYENLVLILMTPFLRDIGVINSPYEISLLHFAASMEHILVLTWLIQNGVNPNLKNSLGEAALNLAALNGRVKSILELITRGADIEVLDNLECTPLHIAAFNDKIEAIHLLLQLGANIEAKDHIGDRPLHLAALNGKIEALELLIKLGANIEAKGNLGYTPLHLAVLGNQLFSIKALIKRGAQLDAKNELGKTPFDIAKENNCYEVLFLFQYYQNRENIRAGVNAHQESQELENSIEIVEGLDTEEDAPSQEELAIDSLNEGREMEEVNGWTYNLNDERARQGRVNGTTLYLSRC